MKKNKFIEFEEYSVYYKNNFEFQENKILNFAYEITKEVTIIFCYKFKQNHPYNGIIHSHMRLCGFNNFINALFENKENLLNKNSQSIK